MIQFGNGNFSFGPLSGVTQGLFETNHDIAFQRFADWAGQNNFNFGGTNAGRWLQQQQGAWNNRFLAQQAAQTERTAAAKIAWDNAQKGPQAQWDAQQAAQREALKAAMNQAGEAYYALARSGLPAGTDTTKLPQYAAYQAAINAYNNFKPAAFVPQEFQNPEELLTWTKFLEQNQGDITGGFNQLTAAMRGANPGAFQIRRNLW